MANVNHECVNCGSKHLRVRTSEKIGLLAVDTVMYCSSCGTEHKVLSQVVRVRTPVYKERPEALRVNKLLKESDLNTPDLFDGVVEQEKTV